MSGPPNGMPTAQQFADILVFLRTHVPTYMSVGEWQQEVTAQIGSAADGRTRAVIAEQLRAWLATFPRAAS